MLGRKLRVVRWGFTSTLAVAAGFAVCAGYSRSAQAQGNGRPITAGPATPRPQQIADNRPLGPARPIQQPAAGPAAPFTITPEHQQYLDKVLSYWEDRSGKIKRYQCAFKRWEYDSVFGPKGANDPKTFCTGLLKFAEPDKGLFKVEKVSAYLPPKPGEAAKMEDRPNSPTEHWVCDGKSVFTFDSQKKLLLQQELPPEMQGKAIVDGPMPFMFGAKAEQIKQRYWLRVITPPDAKAEYWIEAFPKSHHDAANFQKIWIVIDQEQFLPRMLQIFDRAFDERKGNFTRAVYVFEDREVNPNLTPQLLSLFTRDFYEPATPSGWKKQVMRHDEPATNKANPPKRADEAKRPSGLTGKIFGLK